MAEIRNTQQNPTQSAIAQITDKLEQGIKELFESDRFKEYLTTMSKFYNYSFNNTLLIAMQKPDATLIAGYTAWQRNFDRHVMKGERGIRILAPAPYKMQEERDKVDPVTQKPVLDANGKPVKEKVEVMRQAYKVVSVFDVSQTDGKELPDIAVELIGSVDNYAAFFEALKQESPVSIAFEDIAGSAKGYFSPMENRIAIQEGMSEIQTIKTAIHEIAHAKLHGNDKPEPEPAWKVIMVSDGGTKQDYLCDFKTEAEAIAAAEEAGWCHVDENQFEWRLEVEEDLSAVKAAQKDRRTKEVEAESVAYTVCQRYGIETSDYSFGYIAGWSSDKETKELKSSLETIRKTAAEMIGSIDAKLKVLLADKEKEQAVTQDAEPAASKEAAHLRDADIPIYYEMANYAFEAGELDTYRASLAANIACRNVIEETIMNYYGNNRLAAESAVTSVLEKFSPERVHYVLANTIQQKAHDGRISHANKEWASSVEVCSENAARFIVDKVNPGLFDIFTSEFLNRIKGREHEQPSTHDGSSQEKSPEKHSEAHSAEETGIGSEPPVAEKSEEPSAPKHRLTPDEKKIKDAVMDTLKAQIAHGNDGMRSTYRSSEQSFKIMRQFKVIIEKNTVMQNGEPMFAIHRRYSSRKTNGCYRELTPTLEYIRRERSHEAKQEKPSIREQLRAAAKTQPERKSSAKQKSYDVGLE